MLFLEVVCWLAGLCVLYTYALYPLVLGVVARLCGWAISGGGERPRSVAVIVAAHNEEGTIGRRVQELRDAVAGCGIPGKVIVVSDGSTDRTVEILRGYADDEIVEAVELKENGGKAAALSIAYGLAPEEILVFADARQTWAPDALRELVSTFGDPSVGAVGGELVLESAGGVMGGVGLYWRYEKWLRKQESRIHSTVGVSGAISAVRRSLFKPVERGVILDDVWWPLCVAMQGHRVVFNGAARAYDRLPARVHDEFRRKVRTLCGNFQLLSRLPQAVLPWRNPVWWQLISHKVMRLVVPWALLYMLVFCAIRFHARVYGTALLLQVACYALAIVGVWGGRLGRVRLISAAGSFLVLNAAAWLAFWAWALRLEEKIWGKVTYTEAVQPAAVASEEQTTPGRV